MGWKKLIIGEPMPDKNDPRYKERYEREVAAGRKFADMSGLSWLGCRLQSWGQSHKVTFLVVVFGFVIICFIFNVARLVNVYRSSGPAKAVAVERLDSAMQHRSHSIE